MTVDQATGALLIALPLAFNLLFYLLARSFDYPDVLRQPTDQILHRFMDGGARLILLWYAFMLTALLFAPLAVLVGDTLVDEAPVLAQLSVVVGSLAGAVQFLGLARWPFLVPHLAREYTRPETPEPAREATKAVFEAFHRYLGVGVGECLGYLLTGIWSVLVGTMLIESARFDSWLGWPGVVTGACLVLGSLEFVGSNEERGWKLAGVLVPITYVAWSIWLIVVGVVLLMP